MRRFDSLAFSISQSLRGAIFGGLVFGGMVGLGGLAGCERQVSYPEGLSWGDPALPSYNGQPRLAVSCNGDDSLGFVSEDAPDRPQLLGAAAVSAASELPLKLYSPGVDVEVFALARV